MATSNEILAKIEAVDKYLAECRAEAETLSLAAVEGDAVAATRLAEVRAKMDGATADRGVLECAWRAARLREQDADQVKVEARIEKHRDAAKQAAARLLDLAGEIDTTIARFGQLVTDMAAVEGHVRIALSQAGELPADAVPGRSGIGNYAFVHMNNALAKGDFRTKKSLSDIVLCAWAMLLAEENVDDAGDRTRLCTVFERQTQAASRR